MNDIYVGITAKRAREWATSLRTAAITAEADRTMGYPATFEVLLEGSSNNMEGEAVTLHVTNEDMEDRPEVADAVFVDVDF